MLKRLLIKRHTRTQWREAVARAMVGKRNKELEERRAREWSVDREKN